MKKQAYVIIALLSVLFVLFFSHSLLEILDFDWSIFLHDVEKTEKFVFLLLVFSMSMTFLLVLFWRGVEELSLRKMQTNLKRLLAGQEVVQIADPDLDASFKSLSGKLNLLTEALQKAENQSLAREKMQTQLQSVTAILETAQKDLRVLLLHLRPVELEQKSLVEGIQILLKELEEKSDLKVSFKQNVTKLPKKIEEHIFRILQELISNTLRHAQASCLDVYLYQTDVELQLKVVDNGIGFQLGSLDDLSYGLRNIKERVEDMAGTVQLLTAPKQGLAVDIRIPC
ncbi:MAG: sensor histidine kinase [Streptococcus mitis]|nr:sensor histidine kinase [Streptococcus mitis]